MRPAHVCALLLLLAGCKTQLYTSLPEQDAMDMVAVLVQNGIAADRVIVKGGTNTVEVDESRIPDAVNLLRANRLPRPDFANMGDIFQQTGMISSPTAERARFNYALSQEISRTLASIDGVLTARVHIVLPQNDPLDESGKPAAAAVFIRHDARVPMVKMLPQIKMLVANSIEGLAYDKVSVVLLPVSLPSQPKTASSQRSPGGLWPLAGWLLAAAWPIGGGAAILWQRRGRRRVTVAPLTKLRRVS